MDPVSLIIDGWMDDTHGIHYYHKDDPFGRHQSEGFGDSPHHSFAFWSALMLSGKFSFGSSLNVEKFIELREKPDRMIRHPRGGDSYENWHIWGKDQCDFAIFGINHVMGSAKAEKIYKIVKGSRPWYEFFFPNYTVHFARSYMKKQCFLLRLLGDFANLVGCFLYKWKWGDDQVKSLTFRYIVAKERYPTFLNKWVGKFIFKYLTPQIAFYDYFTYKHNPSADNPPPIHLVWLPILKKYEKEL